MRYRVQEWSHCRINSLKQILAFRPHSWRDTRADQSRGKCDIAWCSIFQFMALSCFRFPSRDLGPSDSPHYVWWTRGKCFPSVFHRLGEGLSNSAVPFTVLLHPYFWFLNAPECSKYGSQRMCSSPRFVRKRMGECDWSTLCLSNSYCLHRSLTLGRVTGWIRNVEMLRRSFQAQQSHLCTSPVSDT